MELKEVFQAVTEDSATLNGIIFYPQSEPKAVVVINPATAIKTQYYYPFARFLTENGFVSVVWNYRCFCESKSEKLSQSKASFSDFGTKDIPAILKFVKEKFDNTPIIGIGHSVGGQQLGLVSNNYFYNGFLAVATSSGYARNMPLHYKLQSLLFFKIFGPLSIFIKNYVCSKKFNIMEDLPRYVFSEWKRWCSKENYLFHEDFIGTSLPKGNYEALPFPIHVLTSSDDEVATSKNLDSFWKHVKSKHGIKFTTIKPSNIGCKKIGHLGYFRGKYSLTVWKELLNSVNTLLQPL